MPLRIVFSGIGEQHRATQHLWVLRRAACARIEASNNRGYPTLGRSNHDGPSALSKVNTQLSDDASFGVPREHTTAILLARIHGGDSAAREALFARVEPMLRRWAHGRVPPHLRDAQDTADLVQISLMRALGNLDRFQAQHVGAFYGYLRKILLNVMRDAMRERRGNPLREGDSTLTELPALPGSALEAALGIDGLIAYEQALGRIPIHYQEVVLLRFEFGMSFPEIAAELQEQPDGVRMKLNRALKQMAQLLDAPGD